MTHFEQLEAALEAVRKHYEENGPDFALQSVLRDAGFGGLGIYQSLMKYGLVKHQPKSFGNGWVVNTTSSLQNAIIIHAIAKEPQSVRSETYDYYRDIEQRAKSTDSR